MPTENMLLALGLKVKPFRSLMNAAANFRVWVCMAWVRQLELPGWKAFVDLIAVCGRHYREA